MRAASTVCKPTLRFVPHSGPFARGIHMHGAGRLEKPVDASSSCKAICEDYYNDAPFVQVVDGMPQLKDVVGSNYAHIGVASDGQSPWCALLSTNLLRARRAVRAVDESPARPARNTGLDTPAAGLDLSS